MSNENGGIVRRLLFLILLSWGGWFAYRHWWPENSPQHFSGRLENALNQELSRNGVTDRDVLAQVRKEHSRWGIAWVETQRVIVVGDKLRAHQVAKRLASAARRLGCSVDQEETDRGLEVRVKRFF